MYDTVAAMLGSYDPPYLHRRYLNVSALWNKLSLACTRNPTPALYMYSRLEHLGALHHAPHRVTSSYAAFEVSLSGYVYMSFQSDCQLGSRNCDSALQRRPLPVALSACFARLLRLLCAVKRVFCKCR